MMRIRREEKNPVENCKSNFHVMDRSVEIDLFAYAVGAGTGESDK